MVGLDVAPIFAALADQVRSGLAAAGEDFTVYAYPELNPDLPAVSLHPAGDGWISYVTSMGPNGTADVLGRLVVQLVAGDMETLFRQACRLCAAGAGHASSVPDLVMADRTLGGAVADCVVLFAEWPDVEADPGRIEIPFSVIASKDAAEV